MTFHSPLAVLPTSHNPRTILHKIIPSNRPISSCGPLFKPTAHVLTHTHLVHISHTSYKFIVPLSGAAPSLFIMNSNNNNTSTTKPPSPTPADMQRNRRGSITSAAFTQMFQRSNSTAGVPVFPSAITTAAINERRRLSVSTSTLGISGTSPTSAPGLGRRASVSTNSDLDEFAIEEEDSPSAARTAPVTPFTRRVSFGAAAGMRRPGGTSPGSGNGRPTAQNSFDGASLSTQREGTDSVPLTPPDSDGSVSGTTPGVSWKSIAYSTTQAQPIDGGSTTATPAASRSRPRAASDLFSASRPDQDFNWSEQLRSRAESTVAGSRPSFSFASGLTGSPPRPGAVQPSGAHDRTRSVSEMPAPPAQAPKPRSPPRDTRPKPDHFQERILKGDFYMD